MSYQNLKLEVEDGIAVLYINRPDVLNALNVATLKEMRSALEELDGDDLVRAVVLTGAGEKAFAAGADIKEMTGMSSLEAKDFATLGHSVMNAIEKMEKPVIAAINGYALGGGCELALACDMRIASQKARLGQPEVNLAIPPGFGGTQRLTRLVGKGKASKLIFTGDAIEAAEAESIGLVDMVVPPESLLEEAKRLAKKITSRGPVAVKLAKWAIGKAQEVGLSTGLSFEIEAFSLAFSTEDQKEGMKAFLGKRKPEFRGR